MTAEADHSERSTSPGGTLTLRPSAVAVQCGDLEILVSGPAGQSLHGTNTRIRLDGRTLLGVRRLVLIIDVRDVVQAELTLIPQSVRPEGG